MEYQYWADSPLNVGNGAPSEGAATPSPSEVGKKLVVGLGVIPGMLFLVLWGCTRGVAQISLGCIGFLDVGWDERGYSLGKRSVLFLNIL